MQVDFACDVSQHQRLHTDFAYFKKRLLVLDNFARYFEQCLITALQTLHKPARFLKLLLHVATIRRRAIIEHAHVVIIDSQLWRNVGIEFYLPPVVQLPHENIRCHVFSSIAANRGARRRVEGPNQLDSALQFLDRGA